MGINTNKCDWLCQLIHEHERDKSNSSTQNSQQIGFGITARSCTYHETRNLPRWLRKCFTNSMLCLCFLQNLMWPSQLAVIMKFDLQTDSRVVWIISRTIGSWLGAESDENISFRWLKKASRYVLCDDDVTDDVPVHVAGLVKRRVGKIVEENSLVLKNYNRIRTKLHHSLRLRRHSNLKCMALLNHSVDRSASTHTRTFWMQ